MRHSAPERGARRKGSGHGRVWNLCAALLFVALLVFPLGHSAFAQNATTLLNGVTAASGASIAIGTWQASAVEVQVWSASTSASTILIQQSLDGSTWYTVVTITNVTSASAFYVGPPAPYTRVSYTRSTGTLTAKIVTLQSAQGITGWKAIET
jgi:hypothetical protein